MSIYGTHTIYVVISRVKYNKGFAKKDQMLSRRGFLLQAFGTFLIVYVASASTASLRLLDQPVINPTALALSHGFAFTVGVALTLPEGGGLFDPVAVVAIGILSYAGYIPKHSAVDFATGAPMVAAQLVGGAVAGAMLWATFGGTTQQSTLGLPEIGDGALTLNAFSAEMIGAFAIVTVGVYLLRLPRRSAASMFYVVAFGLTVVATVAVAANISGSSFNTLRHAVPALFSLTFPSTHWIYYIGPTLGIALAVLFSAAVHYPPYRTRQPKKNDAPAQPKGGHVLLRT